MHRVIINMKIVRLFSFIILIGAYLSGDSNILAPIPIDFGVNNGMRSDSTICESCIQEYDADEMGASCCDEATQFNSNYNCEVLEETYSWNCSGCTCAEDDDDWTTNFGCKDDMDACNSDPDVMYHYQDACLFFDECGECGGDSSSCADCAGVPNGDSVEDNCGTCDSDSSNDCTPDCNGEWGGSLVEDECGVCGGPGANDECGCDE